MKWYRLEYINRYNKKKGHTFSGNFKTLRGVLSLFGVDPKDVTHFSINDESIDLQHYLGEEETNENI